MTCQKPRLNIRNFNDLSGRAFGRWTVLAYAGAGYEGRSDWICQCSCQTATIKVINSRYLLREESTSCGCFRRELHAKKHFKHGAIKTREHGAWSRMKERCLNPNNPKYYRYGGRGITVCDRWLSFEKFFSDIGRCPSPNHSIGRINNDGNYEPSNVEWQTPLQQANNTSRNIMVTINSRTASLADWCRELGFKYASVHNRVKLGWSALQALELTSKTWRRSAKILA